MCWSHVPTNDLAPANVDPEDLLRLRQPSPHDGAALWRLASEVGLDLNSPYAYVMWGDHFAGTSVVAERRGSISGFATGFERPDQQGTLFIWQVGVATPARRHGLGALMLDHLLERTGCRFLEATVTPDNQASASLFRAVGKRHAARVEEDTAYPAELFPDGHEPEVRFRIGPIDLR